MMQPHRIVVLLTLFLASFGFTKHRQANQPNTVDPMTFMAAFQAGDAKNYVGAIVQGAGQNFHGMGAVRRAPGEPLAYTYSITIGRLGADGKKIEPIATLAEFEAAEKDSKTVVLFLAGPNLRAGASSGLPQKLEFSGTYAGNGRWLARTQANDKTEALNPGNLCPDKPPVTFSMSGRTGSTSRPNTAYYCVPLLTDATVK